MSGYSTRDVAELLGLTPAQVRHYIHRGLLVPGRNARGEFRFDFQDILLLRIAKGLREARVSPQRALKALFRLRATLGEQSSLTSVSILADGGRVVVRQEDGLWNVESGQGHFNFSARALAGEVAQLRQRRLETRQEELASEDWFDLGVDLEEVDPERSVQAYQRALELDPGNVDAHVNLGRLMQAEGCADEARQHYLKALERAPEHQLALYNLGTLCDEHDELDAAVEYYRRAEHVADAHYNLCRIHELRGDQLGALRHLRRYRQLMAAAGDDGCES